MRSCRRSTAVEAHGALGDVWIERGNLASETITSLHTAGVAVHAKPWTARNGDRFPKSAFAIRWADRLIECPALQRVPDAPIYRALRGGHVRRLRAPRHRHDGRGRGARSASIRMSRFSKSSKRPRGRPRAARPSGCAPPSSTAWRGLIRSKANGPAPSSPGKTPTTRDAARRSPTSNGSRDSRRPREFTSVRVSRSGVG